MVLGNIISLVSGPVQARAALARSDRRESQSGNEATEVERARARALLRTYVIRYTLAIELERARAVLSRPQTQTHLYMYLRSGSGGCKIAVMARLPGALQPAHGYQGAQWYVFNII